jgi:predicted O-methyltransferase YrrM
MRSPVDTASPFDGPWKARARRWVTGGAAKVGVRVEKLEDTATFVDDGGSRLPDLYAKAVRIPGMVTLRRGASMYYMALAGPPGDVVEIGSWQGRSTLFLAQACDDADNGVVHAVDTFFGNPGNEAAYVVGAADRSDLESNFRRNMATAGLAHRVRVYATSSANAAADVARAATGGARLVYIDGEHTYEAVRADLAAYADLLVPGGLLLFDDYSRGFAGVVRAVDEHVDGHPGRYARRVQDDNLLVLRRLPRP